MKSKKNKLDLMSTKELVSLFLKEEEKNLKSLKKERENLIKVIDVVIKKIKLGGRIIYIGAGTSGRIGLLDSVECKPTFNTEIFIGIIAGGKNAFIKAKEGAEDNEQLAINDLKKINLDQKDVLIGIAASGETPYTVSAIKYANKIKSTTIGISTTPKSTLLKTPQYVICPIVDSEIIRGSSRLKSGTLQKQVLNMISSISMIKSNRVFDDLMIDVRPTNRKLVKRAINIISSVCNVSFQDAEELFFLSRKNLKRAIVMYYKNCNLEKSKKILAEYDENLRLAIST